MTRGHPRELYWRLLKHSAPLFHTITASLVLWRPALAGISYLRPCSRRFQARFLSPIVSYYDDASARTWQVCSNALAFAEPLSKEADSHDTGWCMSLCYLSSLDVYASTNRLWQDWNRSLAGSSHSVYTSLLCHSGNSQSIRSLFTTRTFLHHRCRGRWGRLHLVSPPYEWTQ